MFFFLIYDREDQLKMGLKKKYMTKKDLSMEIIKQRNFIFIFCLLLLLRNRIGH